MVWYDTSPLRVRTNRSETALQVYDRGVISGEALRRETGFDDADAPTAAEVAARKKPADTPGGGTEDTPPPATDLPVDESEAPPNDIDASASPGEGLLAAADGLIWNALSAAGDKLRKTPACPRSERAKARDIESARLHTLLPVDATQVEQWRLLDGAWSRAPEIAGRYGLDPECLTASLDGYARELIAAGVAHEYRLVTTVLTGCVGAAA
jgi:hypothetical protein